MLKKFYKKIDTLHDSFSLTWHMRLINTDQPKKIDQKSVWKCPRYQYFTIEIIFTKNMDVKTSINFLKSFLHVNFFLSCLANPKIRPNSFNFDFFTSALQSLNAEVYIDLDGN